MKLAKSTAPQSQRQVADRIQNIFAPLAFLGLALAGGCTALSTLPSVTLGVETAVEHDGDDDRALVTLTNPGTTVAFFVRFRVLQGSAGGEILPSMCDDNYVSLLPGESRTLTARWRVADAAGATPTVVVDGWNVTRK